MFYKKTEVNPKILVKFPFGYQDSIFLFFWGFFSVP